MTELALADLTTVEKAQERNVKLVRSGRQKMRPSWAIYSYRWRLV